MMSYSLDEKKQKEASRTARSSRARLDGRMPALLLILLFSFVSKAVWADASVDVDARFQNPKGRPGEVAALKVSIDIPSGFHLYSMTVIEDGPLPLRIETNPVQVLSPLSHWFGSKPIVANDPNFNKAVEFHEKSATYRRSFLISEQAPLGKTSVEVSVRGQICNEARCIPFREKKPVAFLVESGTVRPERSAFPSFSGEVFGPDRPAPEASDAEPLTSASSPPLGEGFFAFVLIAFLAGLGALVTPCVFPMIPITVSFFSKFAEVSVRRSVTMALIYAGSIIATFTLAGVLVSAVFGAVGMQTLSASVGFNLFLTVLLAVFAFNLFGLFEIQMPSWLVMRAGAKERSLSQKGDGALASQAAGVFFMAVTFTLVSFTCTVGFIGVVLAEAAKGNWFYPAVGMLAFSTAFSLPFFFLAIFPSWAEKLRGKGGDWMTAVKAVLGFLELASAFKFLSNVDLLEQWGIVTRPLVLTLWTGLFGAAGLYLLRVFNLPHSDTEVRHVGPIRMTFAVLLLSLAVYSASGIRDTKSMGGWLDGWLPPAVYPGDEAEAADDVEAHLSWITDDIEKGTAEAKEKGMPLFIDFTGYTCTNCRYMEGAVFPQKAVKERLKKMVRVRAYTDCDQDVCEKQRAIQVERFDTAALPFYAVIDPYRDEALAVHPDMSKNVDEFVAFLDKGLLAFESALRKKAAPLLGKAVDTPEKTPSEKTRPGEPSANDEAVDFTFPYLAEAGTFSLSSLRGNFVLLNFWASWCAPCKKELKEDFPEVLKEFPELRFVTVAFDGEETKAAAKAFAEEAGLTSHIALLGGEDIDEAGLSASFEADANLPITYLIYPDGRIAWMRKGAADRALLSGVIQKTLSK